MMNVKPLPVRVILNWLLPLLLIGAIYEYANSAPQKDAATIVLPQENCSAWETSEAKQLASWPKYVYNRTYGWFDSSHFNTGHPQQVIADVATAVARGGGVITITQELHAGVTNYTAHYQVSGQIKSNQLIGVALGIYEDWSWRFENWQGSLPRKIVNPLTPFAIEDLPSQYLGFVAAAYHLTHKQIFACYLGGAKATSEEPPHLVINFDPANSTMLPEVQRLENRSFEPLVETENGWQHHPWPRALRLTAVGSRPDTWFFLDEETGYFTE